MVRLGISVRVLEEVIDELKADSSIWLKADDPVERRRRVLIQALAKARLLKDISPWRQPELVAPYWSADAGPSPTKSELEGLMTKAKAQIPFLRDGVDVGPWTGDFWHGLRLSEALRTHGGYPRVQPGRPWLEADLEHLPFPGRLSPPDPQGRRWLIKCQTHRLPAGQRFDVAVMAEVEVLVVDYDTEGSDGESIVQIPQGNGSFSNACGGQQSVEINPAAVECSLEPTRGS